ncbi:hypothetical protein GCM10022253_23880 [Sphingomonas endophytica]|uniref:HTH cro/C1-type domain-containing protein n=1 Tax=Sphingomonas endophytica TaxID=869719 RepID=A0ABR6N4L0_9SPHN|nr:hypothetical protein [Sphingomonas endophytica]MBB5725036.1 hypothetical protein [Sphingomonas endophytica]
MSRLLGSELAALLDEYCGRHGITRADFAAASGMGLPAVMEIGARAFPTKRIATLVRDFIDAHPAGIDEAPGVLGGGVYGGAAAVAKARARTQQTPVVPASPAAKREPAPVRRISPEYRARLRDASPSETIATALVETPADLIATVRRRWPDQWHQIVERARKAGTLPGAMLAQVIERGLEAGR